MNVGPDPFKKKGPTGHAGGRDEVTAARANGVIGPKYCMLRTNTYTR
jgi:hypothetical protein